MVSQPAISNSCVRPFAAFFFCLLGVFSLTAAENDCAAGEVDCKAEIRLRARKPVRLISRSEKNTAGSYREIPLADAPEAALSERASDVLQRQTGVQVNRAGAPGTQSLLGLRGSTPEQVEYFIEGLPVPKPYAAPLNLESLPLPLFRSVEIFPSFIPAELPAANIGGAMNFRLRDAESAKYLTQVTGSSLAATAVSGARVTADSLHFAAVEQSRSIYTYPDNNGTAENTADDRRLRRQNEDFSRFGYTGFLRTRVSGWEVSGLADLSRFDRGLPGTQGLPLLQVRRNEERGAVSLKASRRAGIHELQFFGSAGFDRAEIHDPARELIAQTSERQESPQLSAGLGYNLSGSSLSSGIYLRGRFQEISRNAEFLSARSEVQAAWSGAFDPGVMRLAIQLAGTASEDDAATNAFYASAARRFNAGGLSGSALAALRPLAFFSTKTETLLEIYAQVSSAYRAPSLYERFGDNIFVTPSENLKNEQALTNAAGIRGSASCPFGLICSWRSEAWLTGAHDYILFTQNSARTLIAVNASSAQIRGVENELMLNLPGIFLAAVRYTWLDARDYGNVPYYQDKFLPLRPRHHASATLSFFYRSWRFTSVTELRGAIYRDRYNSYGYYLASRLTTDAGVDYIITGTARHTLNFTVKNLTDNQETDIIGYAVPGRYFLVKWTAEF